MSVNIEEIKHEGALRGIADAVALQFEKISGCTRARYIMINDRASVDTCLQEVAKSLGTIRECASQIEALLVAYKEMATPVVAVNSDRN